jgi:hypothetical protein
MNKLHLHRAASLALAAATTFSVLAALDHLAMPSQASATQARAAAGSARLASHPPAAPRS